MDALDCINGRRSARSFLDKPVEFEKLSLILQAGNNAPSAGDLHDWRFILVSDKALIKLVADHCSGQYWIGEAGALIIVCSLPERQEIYYGLRGKRLYNIQDAAAATQNMLLAAHALELGACWVGAFDESRIMDIFSIPREVRPQVIIPIGYTLELPPKKRDEPLKDVVYFNRFGNKIEFIHRVLKDWSIEWDRAINESGTPFIQRSLRRIQQRFISLQDSMKKEAQKRKEFKESKKARKIDEQKEKPLR